jgi:hypothetical protein
MKKIIGAILIAVVAIYSETLFEVKDALNNPVLSVSTDGLRILNQGDTLMVISSNEIKANLQSSKGLSRSFSVTTASSKGDGNDLMRLTSDSTRFWISDTGSGFGVSSQTVAKEKSVSTNFLKVSNSNTQMREGASGSRYTDFSPENIFIGLNSGKVTLGSNNVFLGNGTGFSNANGGNNVYIGTESGYFSENTFQNTYIGYRSGYNMTGASNTAIGSMAGEEAGGTTNNIFIGTSAGRYAAGGNNTLIGIDSGYGDSGTANTGQRNTYLGASTGYATTTGSYNTEMGFNAGRYNRTGSYNTLIGYESGRGSYDNSFTRNVFVGSGSGYSTTTGSNSVYLGYNAGRLNASGTGNVFLGYQAGYSETGSDKLYIDNSNTSSPLLYGDFATDLVKINGQLNVIGSSTLGTLLVAPAEPTSGDDAEIILAEDINGTTNMSMKYDGGLNRLEWWAKDTSSSYGPLMYLSYNTLGGGIPFLSAGNLRPMSDDLFDLGSSTYRWDDIYATNGVIQTSDKRQKSDVKEIGYGINSVMKMKPVSYFWKDNPEKGRKVGLIAQDLLELVPEAVNIGEDENKTLGINYADLTPVLIKAIQEQQALIDKQNEKIQKLEEAIEKLIYDKQQ